MVAHKAPGEDRPTVEVTDRAQGLDKLHRLEIIVKHELATRNAAAHVIRRANLTHPPPKLNNCVIVNVAPMHPCVSWHPLSGNHHRVPLDLDNPFGDAEFVGPSHEERHRG